MTDMVSLFIHTILKYLQQWGTENLGDVNSSVCVHIFKLHYIALIYHQNRFLT